MGLGCGRGLGAAASWWRGLGVAASGWRGLGVGVTSNPGRLETSTSARSGGTARGVVVPLLLPLAPSMARSADRERERPARRTCTSEDTSWELNLKRDGHSVDTAEKGKKTSVHPLQATKIVAHSCWEQQRPTEEPSEKELTSVDALENELNLTMSRFGRQN